MTKYKLILFDLDDTLFDYASAWEAAAKQTFREFPCTAEFDCNRIFGIYHKYDEELWPMRNRGDITLEQLRHMRFIRTLAEFGRHGDESMADCFQNLFWKNVHQHIRPDERVKNMLVQLKRSSEIGIVTNGGNEQWRKLKSLDLDSLFPPSTVFVSEELGLFKPDPQIFHVARQHFGVEAEHTLFVGDSWDADVVGACEAGMAVIWVNSKGRQPSTHHQPIDIVESVLELRQFLDDASPFK